jgi:hypothetical protein
MRIPMVSSLVSVASLAACLGGCLVETHASPVPGPAVVAANGTLTVDWTINGRTDPNQCNQAVAASIEITVYTSSGASVGTFQQTCAAFATSITLAPGSYSASALLIDGASNARTTTVEIPPFTLYGDDTFDAPIDFPASSFL